MTDRRRPPAKPSGRGVAALSIAAFVALVMFLSAQMLKGADPALGDRPSALGDASAPVGDVTQAVDQPAPVTTQPAPVTTASS